MPRISKTNSPPTPTPASKHTPEPLTPLQMKVLSAVRIGRDPLQTDNLTRNHIYLILGTLMHRGFVTPTRIEGDRRRKLYTITPAGKAMLRLSITAYQNLIHQVNF